jgi:hypothetical protein
MIFLFKGYSAIHMYSLKNAVKSDLLVAKKIGVDTAEQEPEKDPEKS